MEQKENVSRRVFCCLFQVFLSFLRTSLVQDLNIINVSRQPFCIRLRYSRYKKPCRPFPPFKLHGYCEIKNERMLNPFNAFPTFAMTYQYWPSVTTLVVRLQICWIQQTHISFLCCSGVPYVSHLSSFFCSNRLKCFLLKLSGSDWPSKRLIHCMCLKEFFTVTQPFMTSKLMLDEMRREIVFFVQNKILHITLNFTRLKMSA